MPLGSLSMQREPQPEVFAPYLRLNAFMIVHSHNVILKRTLSPLREAEVSKLMPRPELNPLHS